MKVIPSCITALTVIMIANATPLPNSYRIYFGSTERKEGHGIYMAEFDAKTGQLSDAIHVSDSIRPGFILIHPDGNHLYATDAGGNAPDMQTVSVSAYRIEKPSGRLIELNTRPSGGKGPCHISFDPSGKWLLVANYQSGSCATLPILENGELGEPVSIQQHSGSGPDPKRQEGPHAHSINCDPAGHHALVTDLGIDKIMLYRFENGTLTPAKQPFISTEPGAGPRHLTFHPNGKLVYACMELSNEVAVYAYSDGTLKEIQTVPTLPEDFDEKSTTSEILTTPDGRFLYVGNRGHESLAIFAIDPESGQLTPMGHESTRGEHPRNFRIDPTGTFLLVANTFTDNVTVFRINKQTGELEFTGNETRVPAPSCVKFFEP